MNFQGKTHKKSSELLEELEQTLRDRILHHKDYKEKSIEEKQRLKHEWTLEFLKSAGVVFPADKLTEGNNK